MEKCYSNTPTLQHQKFMPYTIAKKFVCFMFIFLFVPELAWGHKPLLLVEENDEGGILIETGFSTGESGAGFQVYLKEKATGRILEEFTVPEGGAFEIPMPAFPYTMTFDAGEGHVVTKEGPFSTESSLSPEATKTDEGGIDMSDRQAERRERTKLLVGCALPPLCWITSALCRDSSIQVVALVPPGVTIGDHASWLHDHEEEVEDVLQQVDAVVTIRQTWSQDPLFRYARRWNINTIELDASAPFDPGLSGVSLLDAPAGCQAGGIEECPSGQISPYIWLSLSNASTMADLIAADLQRLLPAEAGQVASNLAGFKQQVFDLKNRYNMKILELDVLDTAALTDRLVYLTGDLNLPVAGYFLQDEYYWTADDIERFRQTLIENEVKAVVHLWKPSSGH